MVWVWRDGGAQSSRNFDGTIDHVQVSSPSFKELFRDLLTWSLGPEGAGVVLSEKDADILRRLHERPERVLAFAGQNDHTRDGAICEKQINGKRENARKREQKTRQTRVCCVGESWIANATGAETAFRPCAAPGRPSCGYPCMPTWFAIKLLF